MTMLAESKALFVRRWGEMGGYWGINRTMAEIHALLFVSDHPLCTDDVMARLEISRGNASMNLRSLVDWGLIDRVHERGDRKEYFICRTNAWEMFETIIRLRRRREVEPIVETIARCRSMVSEGGPEVKSEDVAERRVYVKRLEEMHDFLEVVGAVVDVMLKVGPSGIGRISRMIAKIAG
jgi:HTH-type transcriptional regulator, glycine betaine synthesis regulator